LAERCRIRRNKVFTYAYANNERTAASCSNNTVGFIFIYDGKTISAFKTAYCAFYTLKKIQLMLFTFSLHKMGNHFSICI
jgi:hypothetical protein